MMRLSILFFIIVFSLPLLAQEMEANPGDTSFTYDDKPNVKTDTIYDANGNIVELYIGNRLLPTKNEEEIIWDTSSYEKKVDNLATTVENLSDTYIPPAKEPDTLVYYKPGPDTIISKDATATPQSEEEALLKKIAEAKDTTWLDSIFPNKNTLELMVKYAKKISAFEMETYQNMDKRDFENFISSLELIGESRKSYLESANSVATPEKIFNLITFGQMVSFEIVDPVAIQDLLIMKFWKTHPHHNDGRYIPIMTPDEQARHVEKQVRRNQAKFGQQMANGY
jgi:hypothetical protein